MILLVLFGGRLSSTARLAEIKIFACEVGFCCAGLNDQDRRALLALLLGLHPPCRPGAPDLPQIVVDEVFLLSRSPKRLHCVHWEQNAAVNPGGYRIVIGA